jgi:hypothetical protein
LFAPINRLKYNNSKLHSVTPPINRIEMQQLKMIKADTIVPLVDVEKGTFSGDESHKVIDDAPFEPYLELRQIAELHPESRVDLTNIEKSAGLSSSEAAKRLITHGKNSLTLLRIRSNSMMVVASFLLLFSYRFTTNSELKSFDAS